jgi:surface antigen
LAAASIAALVIGLGGGYWTADRQFRSDLAQRELQFQQDRLAMEGAVSAALEKHASGETLRWENAESGSHASITPVRTFKNSDGRWCREYLHDSEIGRESATRRAIACRVEQGTWRTRLVALEGNPRG